MIRAKAMALGLLSKEFTGTPVGMYCRETVADEGVALGRPDTVVLDDVSGSRKAWTQSPRTTTVSLSGARKAGTQSPQGSDRFVE